MKIRGRVVSFELYFSPSAGGLKKKNDERKKLKSGNAMLNSSRAYHFFFETMVDAHGVRDEGGSPCIGWLRYIGVGLVVGLGLVYIRPISLIRTHNP